MTKFQATRTGDYPTLGFAATSASAILDGSLSTPPLTIPPDATWSVYVGGSAETGITRYVAPSATPITPTSEVTDGWLLAYSDALNTYVPQNPADLITGEWASALEASIAELAVPIARAVATPPVHFLDVWNSDLFDSGANTWVAGQVPGTVLSLASGALAGATTITLTDATGVLDDVVLLTETGTDFQDVYKVVGAPAGNVVTLDKPLSHGLASGAAIYPMWLNESHLSWSTGPGAGFGYLARWMFSQEDGDGNPLVGPTDKSAILFNSWGAFDNGDMYADQYADLFPSAPALVKAGVGGNTSSQLLARVDALPSDVKNVFFNEPGVNDTYQAFTATDQLVNLRLLVGRIRARGMVPVYLGPVPLFDFPTEAIAQQAAMVAALGDGTAFKATDLGDAYITSKPTKSTVGVGKGALGVVSTGQGTAFGVNALAALDTGVRDVGVGASALSALVVGSDNVALGFEAGKDLLNSGNTFLGANAGSKPNNNAANTSTTAANNTFIGCQTGQGSTTQVQYATALGFRALVSANGAFAIGTSASGVGASSTVADTGVLGTSVHTISVPGKLALAASTTAKAPLSIPQGVTVTSPANGDVWMTSAGLVWQNASAVRQAASILTATSALDFPSIAAGGQQELTITVTGAAANDNVIVGPPPIAGLLAGLQVSAYVSTTNTVTIRLSNVTGSAIDPPSATWRATVIR